MLSYHIAVMPFGAHVGEGTPAHKVIEDHSALLERCRIPKNFAHDAITAKAIAYHLVAMDADRLDTLEVVRMLIACGVPGVSIKFMEKARADALKKQREGERTAHRDLPTVRYRMTDPDQAMVEAEAILAANHENQIFVFEGKLVRIEVSEEFDSDGDTIVLREITVERMLDHIGREIRWQMVDNEGVWQDAPPPALLARMMVQRNDRFPYRRLRALARCPFMRPNGDIVSGFGYDPESGIFLTDDIRVDVDTLTPQQALKGLRGLFKEAAYANPASESAVIAGAMTAVLRPMFPIAPGWVVSAHEGGSGKSALHEVAGIIATGKKPDAISMGTKEDEFEKRLVGVVLAGDTLLMIDNCNGKLQGEFLAQVVTMENMRLRALGSSTMTTMRNNIFTMVNGNNIEIVGEQRRRYFITFLEPDMERPETREFTIDIHAEAVKWRSYLLTCILTIARAYIKEGRPPVAMSRLVGFDAWSALVRASLIWLGMPDPLDNAELMREEDSNDQALRNLLMAWPRNAGGLTVAQLCKRALEVGQDHLLEALMTVATGGSGALDRNKLGYYLRKNKGMYKGGIKIAAYGDKDGRNTWGIMSSAGAEGKSKFL